MRMASRLTGVPMRGTLALPSPDEPGKTLRDQPSEPAQQVFRTP